MESLKISYDGTVHVIGLKRILLKLMVNDLSNALTTQADQHDMDKQTDMHLFFVHFLVDSSSSDDTNQPRKKGRLSSRMLIPGNTWQTVWTAAKPVPARRQVFFKYYFSVSIELVVTTCVDVSETFI